jgi:hypothetical protein
MFILVVIFLPGGIVSIPRIVTGWFQRVPKEEMPAALATVKAEVKA